MEKGLLVPAVTPDEVCAPSFSCHCHPSNLHTAEPVFHLADVSILLLVYLNGVDMLPELHYIVMWVVQQNLETTP